MKALYVHRAMIAVVAVFLMCANRVAHTQDVVIRMGAAPASTSDDRTSELTRTPDLLIFVSPALLASEDLALLQRSTAAVFQGLNSKIPIRMCLIRDGAPEIAGLFRSAQEIRSVLRALEWGYTLIAGNSDIEFLKHQAEVSDVFGGNASAAYRRLAEAIEKNGTQDAGLELALEGGWKVSLRDGDAAGAAWFNANRARKSKIGLQEEAKRPDCIWIPDGFDALMFIAGGSPERFLLDYCCTVLAREPEYDTAQTRLYRNR